MKTLNIVYCNIHNTICLYSRSFIFCAFLITCIIFFSGCSDSYEKPASNKTEKAPNERAVKVKEKQHDVHTPHAIPTTTWFAATCEGAFVPVNRSSTSKSHISGTIPENIRDDSSWADVDVSYTPISGNVYAGTQALRTVVHKIRNGCVQVISTTFPIQTGTWSRISCALRTAGMPVSIGIRKRGKPYTFLWKKDVYPRPEWTRFSYVIPPMPYIEDACIMFTLPQEGSLDLDDIYIASIPPPEEDTTHYLTRNRLSNSSFPAGLTAPWGAGNTGFTDSNWQPDTAVTGPTGVVAVKVNVPRAYKGKAHVALRVPFEAMAGETYTISVHAKGIHDGQNIHLRMAPPEETIYKSPFTSSHTIGTDWKRVSFSLKLPPTASGYYITSLVFADDTWIDGIQLEKGDMTPFTRTGETEISLTVPRPYGIYTNSEPIEYELTALNVTKGMSLTGCVSDVYGTVKECTFPPLRQGTIRTGKLPLSTDGLPAYGTYTLTVQALNAKKEACSRPVQLLVHRVRTPKKYDEFSPDSLFGIHILPIASQAYLARALGFKWVRLFDTEWINNAGAGPDNPFHFRNLDKGITHLHKNKFCILGILGSAPKWATHCPPHLNGWTADRFIIRNYNAWTNYCYSFAKRYKGAIDTWEIWNEPFLTGFLARGHKDGAYIHAKPEDYLPMLKTAAAAVRKANPKAKVLWNRGGEQEMTFDTNCIALGACKYVDFVTYHQYVMSFSPDVPVATKAKSIRETQPAYARDKPIWNSEGGSPHDVVNWYTAYPPKNRRTVDKTWADYLARYYLTCRANDVEKFFVYTHASFGKWTQCYTLLHSDNTMRPSSLSIANLAWHIEDKNFAQHSILPFSVSCHIYTNATETVAVIYAVGVDRPVVKKSTLLSAARDVFGNDVELPVVITGSPVYLTFSTTDVDTVVKELKKHIVIP